MVVFRVIQASRRRADLTAQTVMSRASALEEGLGQGLFGVGAMLGPHWPEARGLDHLELLLAWVFYINVPLGLLAAALWLCT